MRLKSIITIVGVLLALAACRGSGPGLSAPDIRVSSLYGSDLSGLQVEVSDRTIKLSTDRIDSKGLFLLLGSGSYHHFNLVNRNENDNLLYVQGEGRSGFEIGIVPIDTESSTRFVASFELSETPELRSTSLFEDPYRVDEIIVVPSPLDNYVSLNWVEKNIGDYDFNGEVNSADLVPIVTNLGESGFRNSTAANTTKLFYIDGDENNEINLADIVPIARNFGNSISGYYIHKNGEPVLDPLSGEPAFYGRPGPIDAEPKDWIINDAPVFFQVSVEGSFEDQYSLVPVDSEGDVQSQSVVFDGVELQSYMTPHEALQGQGISLFDLSGGGRTVPDYSEMLGSYFCVMRIIWPDDTVDGIDEPPDMLDPLYWNSVPQSFDEGTREPGEGYRFDKLKRPSPDSTASTPYILEILFAPTVDLLTGEQRSYGGSKVPNSFYYRLAVPVYIPHGHRTVFADFTLDLVPEKEGPRYDIMLYNHQYQTGDEFDNSVIRIELEQDGINGGLDSWVSRVHDPVPDFRYLTGDFTYSPRFHDSNGDGLSDQLQRRLITQADAQYYNLDPFPIILSAEPQKYDPLLGSLDLFDVRKVLSGGQEVFYAASRTVQLCETTRFNWVIRDENGEHPVQVSPELLNGLGNNAEILMDVSVQEGQNLGVYGLPSFIWVDEQTITLDLINAN